MPVVWAEAEGRQKLVERDFVRCVENSAMGADPNAFDMGELFISSVEVEERPGVTRTGLFL